MTPAHGARYAFEQRAGAIEALVRKLEDTADPGVQATARELVQALMELHSAGLERILELVDGAGETGRALIDSMADDGLVKLLLVLHGLHPLTLEERVRRAVDQIRPSLAKSGGEVDRIVVDDSGRVTVGVRATASDARGRGSSSAALKALVEQVIHDGAPDATAVSVDVGDMEPALAFVPVSSLRRSAVPT